MIERDFVESICDEYLSDYIKGYDEAFYNPYSNIITIHIYDDDPYEYVQWDEDMDYSTVIDSLSELELLIGEEGKLTANKVYTERITGSLLDRICIDDEFYETVPLESVLKITDTLKEQQDG